MVIETAVLSTAIGSVSSLIKGALDTRATRKQTEATTKHVIEQRQLLVERLKHERLMDASDKKDKLSQRHTESSMGVFQAEEKSFQIAQAKMGVAQWVRPVLLCFLGYSAYQYAGDSIEFQEDIVSLFVMASGYYFGARIAGSLK